MGRGRGASRRRPVHGSPSEPPPPPPRVSPEPQGRAVVAVGGLTGPPRVLGLVVQGGRVPVGPAPVLPVVRQVRVPEVVGVPLTCPGGRSHDGAEKG